MLSDSQIGNVDPKLIVSQFIENGHWNRHLLMSVVDVDVVNKICSVSLPLTPQRDSCY